MRSQRGNKSSVFSGFKILKIMTILVSLAPFALYAGEGDTAFKIGKKSVLVKEIYEQNQGKFYSLEKQKYELIEGLARQEYLDYFWEKQAKKEKTSVSKARQSYLKAHASVSEAEIKKGLDRFKDHPRLKDLSDKEKRAQISDYLRSMKTRDVTEQIISNALRSKDLVIVYTKPKEPVYDIKVKSTDPIKYGPKATDTKPLGCSSDCAITVVEYSEYQCPFCTRVLPTVKKLMTEYKGKVRWIVRDFPLGFHNRAKPAAVAARCSFDQGKFWQMYETLFENQRALSDADLKKYGKVVGLNQKKYEDCLSKPEKQYPIIDANYASGERNGVTGTPAFFINGRKISGALPYQEFKRIFDEELAAQKGKK